MSVIANNRQLSLYVHRPTSFMLCLYNTTYVENKIYAIMMLNIVFFTLPPPSKKFVSAQC